MAAPNLRRSPASDFDPSELLATHEQHEKNISDLNGRLSKLEGHLCTPQALASYFEESAKDSRVLEGVFASMFCRFMNENGEVQIALEKRIEQVDRSHIQKFVKRFGFAVYSFLLIIVGLLGKALGEWILSLIPHAK